MTHQDAIEWLNWFVQVDDTAEFMEEDGGLVMSIKKDDKCFHFVGTDVLECIHQASQDFPAV